MRESKAEIDMIDAVNDLNQGYVSVWWVPSVFGVGELT